MNTLGKLDFKRNVDELAVGRRRVDPDLLPSVDLDEEVPRVRCHAAEYERALSAAVDLYVLPDEIVRLAVADTRDRNVSRCSGELGRKRRARLPGIAKLLIFGEERSLGLVNGAFEALFRVSSEEPGGMRTQAERAATIEAAGVGTFHKVDDLPVAAKVERA